MTYLVFDLIVLILLIAFALRGAARGLVLSLCSLLAVVVAFAGAGIAARTLSPMVAQALEPKFAAVIEEHLEESLRAQAQQGHPLSLEDVPLERVLDVLRDMGLYDSLIDKVDQAVEEGLTHAAASAAAKVAAALAQSAAYQLIFAVSFVLLVALWQVVSRVLDLVSRLPVLDTLNKSMGALFGLLQAWVVVCVLAWLLRFGNVVDQETVEKTFLLRLFMDFNPLALLGSLT